MADEDIKFRYVFSGSLTQRMHDMIVDMNGFEPYDALVSQVDRSGLDKAIKWKHEGFYRWLFCDSGAFSVHTGKAKVTQDDYIELINKIDDDIDVFAQLDRIPGTYKKPKSDQDYIDSAEESWESFLYMRENVPHKHKIMPVFHFGEDIKYLQRMLEYVDKDGEQLSYIGLSPANDASTQDRNLYLQNMYDVIHASSNPNVKTHVYGFTSLQAMAKFPCYSADSITHRLISGYNKIYSRNFGIISTSKKPRSTKAKSNLSFLESADEMNLNLLRQEFVDLGVDRAFMDKYGFEGDDVLEWIPEDNNLRVATSVHNIQYLSKTKYRYQPTNLVRSKKLFQRR